MENTLMIGKARKTEALAVTVPRGPMRSLIFFPLFLRSPFVKSRFI